MRVIIPALVGLAGSVLVAASPLAQRAMKEMAVRSQHLPALEAIRFGETMRRLF